MFAVRSPSSFEFTSESVSEGHPDKICDQISDAILDRFLKDNPQARSAVETLVTTDLIVIAGEVKGVEHLSMQEIEAVARQRIKEIGYEQRGFHWATSKVEIHLFAQSADIAMGVDAGTDKDEGAGDQGIMFGFACDETPVLMPAPIYYSHRILQALADARHAGKLMQLGPDAKSQVTLAYENGKPVRATSVVVSTQHAAGLTQKDVKEIVRPYVLDVLPEGWMCPEERFYVNPTGQFIIGGPVSDCGLTGRKIIVDTYGGAAPHGGGAFSGKDPTKVDRSAAYMARYLAKNVVAAGLTNTCQIQLSYAIGVSYPLSVYICMGEDSKVSVSELEQFIRKEVDLSPRGIRSHLAMNKPIYCRTAAYGHFGREPEADGGFSWERTDLAEKIRKSFG